MEKKKKKTMKVRVGKHISGKTFDKTKSKKACAEYIKKKVDQVKESN